mmetsp:Transcript_1516/g.3406  ORF Transcript_1516/g.3406 Transcript_1516/m.3406 type:complete len:499 (+) Transcript_1516:41-1537(+)
MKKASSPPEWPPAIKACGNPFPCETLSAAAYKPAPGTSAWWWRLIPIVTGSRLLWHLIHMPAPTFRGKRSCQSSETHVGAVRCGARAPQVVHGPLRRQLCKGLADFEHLQAHVVLQPLDADDVVVRADELHLHAELERLPEDVLAAVLEGRRQDRAHAADHLALPRDAPPDELPLEPVGRQVRDDHGEDRHRRAVLGHEPGGAALVREDDDQLGADLLRGPHRARADRLELGEVRAAGLHRRAGHFVEGADRLAAGDPPGGSGGAAERAARVGGCESEMRGDIALHGSPQTRVLAEERRLVEGLVHEELKVLLVVEVLLRLDGDARHALHRLDGVLPAQRLRPEEDTVDAVEHRVGDVGGLCPRRPRGVGHRVNHAGDAHGFADDVACRDDRLLDEAHLLGLDIEADVAPRDDDPIRVTEDVLELEERLSRLDLRHDLRVRHPELVEDLSGVENILGGAGVAEAEPVDVKLVLQLAKRLDVALHERGQRVLKVGNGVR